MRYLRVQWLHSRADDPVEILSEVDDQGWEIRKLELFRDGSIGYADSTEATASTALGEEPVPSVEEIAADPQFRPTLITRDDFEKVWHKRLSSAKSA